VQAALAPLRRPARFEPGTAAALIVCDDANLERSANATVFGRFSNNGCSGGAVHRVYVQRTVAEAFIHKVIHKVRALKSGPYTDPFCEIGPLASGDGLEHLRAVLQDALDRRALLVAGGFPAHVTGRDHGERRGADRQGWYWPPTVLTQVDHAMRVMAEPLFGPILPIQWVEDDREAIALANDTDCGFDACVFSGDLSRANRIAAQLRAGWVTVNDVPVNMPRLHGSGARPAGVDRDEGGDRCCDPGAIGPRQFTVCQGLLIDDGRRDSEAHWFPYSAAKLQAVERALAARARPFVR
jgi:acyl-CoA reductase-like NAD-dependent aldehyde dehydrogenase